MIIVDYDQQKTQYWSSDCLMSHCRLVSGLKNDSYEPVLTGNGDDEWLIA